MGGAIRRITRIFSPPAYTPPAAQTVTAAPAAAKTTISGASMAKVRGAGYGTTTVMTEGIDETEANVAKAVLGEGKKKKKYV